MKKLLIGVLLLLTVACGAQKSEELPRVIDFNQVTVMNTSFDGKVVSVDSVVLCEEGKASIIYTDTSFIFNAFGSVMEVKILGHISKGIYAIESDPGCELPTMVHIYNFRDEGVIVYVQHGPRLTRFAVKPQECDEL